jgi:glycosyltransferase involved in cell wall biosynthesis
MIDAVAVVVPVHDEAELLPSCLAALEAALSRSPVRSLAVIVLDACRDASAEISRRWAAERDDIVIAEIDARNVGYARAIGATHALARCSEPRDRIWLATTDADTHVPRDWLREQLRLADAGAEAFAGTIAVADWGEHGTGLGDRFAEFYARDVGDSHPHIHGANLGVRADAYLAAGGFAPLPTGEDHALWRALSNRSRVATRGLPVITSARKHARAPAGFSGFLVAFAEAG